MLTGTVTYDLTDVPAERMRNRLASLPEVPTGARVVIRVGALAPEPEAVRFVTLHEPRLHMDVHGTPRGVRLWLEALRTNLGEVIV